MEADFWHGKWERNEIGFHKDEYNPKLVEFFPKLELAKGSHVFVPLAGKTLDMIWLRDQGYQVTGIELSDMAIKAFFAENQIAYKTEACGNMSKYTSEGITFYKGDFFELQESDLAAIDGIYDRAATVALPPDMRKKYHTKLSSLLPAKGKMLLVTLEYDQDKFQGPPFSVVEEEVRETFSDGFKVELLNSLVSENVPPRFQELGMELHEKVYLLTKQ
jgi:thiopurine S-methyltransferase